VGISDLCLEIHRALPVGATLADITEVAMLAISGTVGAEVVQVSPAPDLMDVSSLGIRESDGQSILRRPNTMRWSAIDHLNLEEQVMSQARRPIRPLVTAQQVRDELDSHHQDLDAEQRQAVVPHQARTARGELCEQAIVSLCPIADGSPRGGQYSADRTWTERQVGPRPRSQADCRSTARRASPSSPERPAAGRQGSGRCEAGQTE
jgi:hypothetical protein